ncbi:AAA family ATPase [Dyadobacter sp. CY261]|uniref:GumC family protein n=1 Tax=Dyadobacter sp. CY261 TaxID=2907203 RepID=UPI001F172A18|nr:GNVR domain-containing protein [Dyadobacter sp. CY261]MCF0071406.1 AAA family ATPase [Dyadobacter sp. CY261]
MPKFQISEFAQRRDWANDPLWKAIKYRRHWFLLSPMLFVTLGLLFLRYKTPRYGITASLLIRDDARGSDFRETALLEELGFPDASSSVENEIEILKSRTLLSQVVDDLHLTIQYFASGHVKTTELYDKTPFKVKFLKRRTAKPETYHISKGIGNSFKVQTGANSLSGTFGGKLLLPHGLATIDTTHFKPAADYEYSFSISNNESILEHYAHVLTVQAPNKTASLVGLSIQDELPKKGEAILKQLIFRYQKASIAEKNKAADNTIAFINTNLNRVSSDLAKIETNIEHFRKRHKVIDMDENSRLVLQKLNGNESQEKELSIRFKLVQALETHLSQKPATAIPSALYPQDNNFSELITKYNEMQLLLAKTLTSLSDHHPDVKSLHKQLNVVRNNLSDAIQYQKQELTLSIAAIRNYARDFNAKIAQIPGQERLFLSQSREQGIQQELYLFLLKKRVETAISRSANIANARIIDPPQASPTPTYPNRQLTLLVALLTGILIPAGALYVGLLIDEKITSKDDIIQQCDVTVIGEISKQNQSNLLLKPAPRSLVKEQFRSLRTNLHFIAGARQNIVILLTSAMAGEGKSFVAAHLAQSLALANKKVLLIDFDLRKPTLATILNLQTEGITEAIALGNEPHIQRYGTQYPFDFLASGKQCPETGELLLSSKMNELVLALKKRYDYILLDSPPVGLVGDARLLGIHADMTLYIVRQHFTFRHQVAGIQALHTGSQLPEMYIILNGTRNLHKYQYGYY